MWATDITYIPKALASLYLVAIMDWYPRVASCHGGCRTRSIPSFCVDALEEALARFGPPEIFNTDQGVQFTRDAFTKPLR